MNTLNEKKMIEEIIGEVESYNLINNYGFKKEGLIIAHTLNIYGACVDFWEITEGATSKEFNSFEEMLEHLKTINKSKEVNKMNKYQITISETLEKTIEITAETEAEAIEQAREEYYNGNVVLDYNDLTSTDFTKTEEEEELPNCSECGEVMKEGYCIEGGIDYYCSDECLHKHYTEDEYKKMYDDGNGDSYWTEW